MENFRLTTDASRISTVWLDPPSKSVNTIGPAVLTELGEVLAALARDKPVGVIFASGKPKSFIAGADLFEIKRLNRNELERFLADGQEVFNRIANLPMPTVAAINGDCLGGGLELALACAYRVAADNPAIKIGLPEVKLGILPGWGGTVRLPRTVGLTTALPLLLAGKTLPPRKAAKAGVVDEVVRPEALLDAARRLVLTRPAKRKWSMIDRAAARLGPVRRRIFANARAKTTAQTYGHYPAPLRLIEVVREGYENGADAGFAAERRGLLDLMQTDAGRNLLRIFFLRQEAKRAAAKQVDAKPRDVAYAAVIGGGTMGAGIVHAMIGAGVEVRLVEVDPAAVSAGLRRVRGLLDEDVKAGRTDALAARHAMNRVVPTCDWGGLGLCDFAVEAVVEKLDVKRDIFAKLEKLTRPGVPLASNTSSFSIASLDEAVTDPRRVIGMHFFNPVPKMPLVEIVRGPHSDAGPLATAVALAGRLGKTPVLVNDTPGFLVNRVLIPYLAEAALVAGEGAPVAAIDAAMKKWGWPMGPFELLDEIGLDVGAEVLKSLAGNVDEYAGIPAQMSRAVERGWLGRKSARGFYVHGPKRGAAPKVNPELHELWGRSPLTPPTPVDEGEIQWRLMLPMVNEAARLLTEEVVSSPEAIDLATVMGLGFPPFRGGLAHFADSIGAHEIERRSEEMAAMLGPRFLPSGLWRRLEEQHMPLGRFTPRRATIAVPETQPMPGSGAAPPVPAG